MAALSGLEMSRGKAIGHMLSGVMTMDTNLKLICQDSVLSAVHLTDFVTKEAYHLPFEPASSGLFGEGLSSLSERSDKIAE